MKPENFDTVNADNRNMQPVLLDQCRRPRNVSNFKMKRYVLHYPAYYDHRFFTQRTSRLCIKSNILFRISLKSHYPPAAPPIRKFQILSLVLDASLQQIINNSPAQPASPFLPVLPPRLDRASHFFLPALHEREADYYSRADLVTTSLPILETISCSEKHSCSAVLRSFNPYARDSTSLRPTNRA